MLPQLVGEGPRERDRPDLGFRLESLSRSSVPIRSTSAHRSRCIAGVEKTLRPFHDLRHASLTNGAAAGEAPIKLMTRAGHSNMKTTQTYLHLAGAAFHDEAAALERRLLGTECGTDRREPQTT